MRTGSPLIAVLALVSGCATAARAPESPAAYARPEADPVLLETPQGAARPVPVEQVQVRVHRAADGRVTILEFLSPGLPEPDQVAIRAAYEAGELRLAGAGGQGEESWVTTLIRARGR